MQDSPQRTHPCLILYIIFKVMWCLCVQSHLTRGCSCQKGSKALSFWSLARCTQTCVWGLEIFQRLTQPLIYTQTTTGWHPDTLAVRTSNRLREAIKPQRQRALFKSHCFLLLTYILIFFLTSCIRSSFFLSFVSTSTLPLLLQHVDLSIYHPSFLLQVWCLANGQTQRLGGEL